MRAFLLVVSVALFGAHLGSASLAQSISVDELTKRIDDRVNALNPYHELLADPDPDRSMAAMQIMLESEDPVLIDIAVEFGLLSGNPQVRDVALDSFLATGPNLTLEFDASVSEDRDLRRVLLGNWKGAEGPNKRIFATWKVGPINPSSSCYEFEGFSGQCFLRVTPGGVSVSGSNLSGQLTNDGSGQLVGSVSIPGVAEPVPTTIALIK